MSKMKLVSVIKLTVMSNTVSRFFVLGLYLLIYTKLIVGVVVAEELSLNEQQINLVKLIDKRRGLIKIMKVALPPLVKEDTKTGLLTISDPKRGSDVDRKLIEQENENRKKLFKIRHLLFPSKTMESIIEDFSKRRIDEDRKYFPNIRFRCAGSPTMSSSLMPVIAEIFLKSKGYRYTSITTFKKKDKIIILVTGKKQQNDRVDAIQITPILSDKVLNEKYDLVFDASKNFKEEGGVAVAKDGLAVVVHPMNSISEISIESLKKILDGSIRNWSKLKPKHRGGIKIYMRERQSGVWLTLQQQLNIGSISKSIVFLGSNEEVENAIFKDKKGIGVLPMGYASKGENKPLRLYTSNKEGYRATLLTVLKEKYLIRRDLSMKLSKRAPSLAKEFARFVKSPEGQKSIQRAGYVPFTN